MGIYSKDCLHLKVRIFNCVFLVTCWCIGLLLGYLFFKPFSYSLMRSAVQQPVSIVGLFLTVFFPLIFAYFSFLINKPIFLQIVCFFKAVAFGFSGAFISAYFQSAGWLICLFMMFSDVCFSAVFLVLLLRCFSGSCFQPMVDLAVSAILGICIVTADYFVVSPFLQGLL